VSRGSAVPAPAEPLRGERRTATAESAIDTIAHAHLEQQKDHSDVREGSS
jgi:hypothetical protein